MATIMNRIKTPTLSKFATETKDLGEGRIRAIVSTESQDRDGDIIRQSGWDLARFKQHPILLVDHNYFDIRREIGKWESMQVDGTTMIGEARYFIGKGNEVADWAYYLASDENMAAFSVGFIPDWAKAKELDGGDEMWPNYEFKGQELLEVSQVTVPSNPEALQLALKSQGLDPLIRDKIQRVLNSVETSLATGNETHIDTAALIGPEVIDALADEIAKRLEDSLLKTIRDSYMTFPQVEAASYSMLDTYLEVAIREALNGRD